MDAMNVEKLSAKKAILLSTNDAILERNPMDAFHVVKSSTRSHSSLDIKDTGEKPCQWRKSFFEKSYLSVHQRSHAGPKPYQHSECGKTFCQVLLTSHEEIHTGKKSRKHSECCKL